MIEYCDHVEVTAFLTSASECQAACQFEIRFNWNSCLFAKFIEHLAGRAKENGCMLKERDLELRQLNAFSLSHQNILLSGLVLLPVYTAAGMT
ncbi:hypothetical protein I2930_03735 [Escherichia coli]|nr:hypothetical protein [Escherichia coli]MBV4603517.1 hypothetical protein [Escherichia coli]MBV4829281.1 hypothetical protein [Escherichia coli]